ncbi:MAG: hypothetical protein Q3972_08315 [Corynebacterium sp.]|nr:hypothetical protein [Corynebacterium sp.]
MDNASREHAYVLLNIPRLPLSLRPVIEDVLFDTLSPSEVAAEAIFDAFMTWTRVPGGVSCKEILDAPESELADLEFHLQLLADRHGFEFSMRPARMQDLLMAR